MGAIRASILTAAFVLLLFILLQHAHLCFVMIKLALVTNTLYAIVLKLAYYGLHGGY